jgi:hypothetical protein
MINTGKILTKYGGIETPNNLLLTPDKQIHRISKVFCLQDLHNINLGYIELEKYNYNKKMILED